mgnify:CR=1 FL=1
MSDLTSLFTDTLAKFSFRAVLSAAATLLICLVAVHLLGKLLRRLLARTSWTSASEIPAGRGER